ncbi:MAG: ANTAR domain-containing protein [Sporichthyaceae bacterium]
MNEHRLAETFVFLADTLVADFDLIEFLYSLVDRCKELLDVSAVGLMLADASGQLTVMASTSEELRLLELFQLQVDQGPCLECFHDGVGVEEDDLGTAADRWDRFAPAGVAAGFRSVHALPMRLREETIGALNLFHERPHALQDADIQIGQAMVDVATIGLLQVELGRRHDILLAQLRTALDTRIVIEQAKGVLAERRGIRPNEAFSVLRAHARAHHMRLTDLAHDVIENRPAAAGLLSSAPDTHQI